MDDQNKVVKRGRNIKNVAILEKLGIIAVHYDDVLEFLDYFLLSTASVEPPISRGVNLFFLEDFSVNPRIGVVTKKKLLFFEYRGSRFVKFSEIDLPENVYLIF